MTASANTSRASPVSPARCSDDLAKHFHPEAETAAELHELLRNAIVQARNIARGIAPVHMDEAGLASALDDLAANTRRLHEIDCDFRAGRGMS